MLDPRRLGVLAVSEHASEAERVAAERGARKAIEAMRAWIEALPVEDERPLRSLWLIRREAVLALLRGER